MKSITRLLAILFVVPATYLFVGLATYLCGELATYLSTWWDPFSLFSAALGEQRWIVVIIANVVSLICAVAAGRFVWSKPGSAHQGLSSSLWLGALLFGGVGFSAGFVGPMIFAPQNNLGPLLGIIITGPLGFVLGGIAGFLYWSIRFLYSSIRSRKAQP